MRKTDLALLALLTMTALAGCLTGGDEAPPLDSDGDGVSDVDEVAIGSDPFDAAVSRALSFLDSVDLVCPDDNPAYVVFGTQYDHCAAFAEPVMEIAGDGTIWYSATCCVGQSPPIWTSRDGGLTFQALPFADGTGVTRDAAGIEGDFAIDDAGNVYFFDILAGAPYFTKFSADGTHQHTSSWPFEPAVDRPWVRAGVEDEVWAFYNQLIATILYHSTDGGLTWDPIGQSFPCGLMAMGQGPERDDLVLGGCTDDPSVWITHDGGQTFSDRIHLPIPEGETVTESYFQSSMDAAGNTYVPITHTVHPAGPDGPVHEAISLYVITSDLQIRGPFLATTADGLTDKPWTVAGRDGVFAMAYYHADHVDRVNESTNATWYLEIAYTLDGDAEQPTWHRVVADPEPVLEGTFGRNLGDFLELRQAPNGDLAVAYAHRDPGQPLVNRFVRSALGIDFGPEVFRNGPQA